MRLKFVCESVTVEPRTPDEYVKLDAMFKVSLVRVQPNTAENTAYYAATPKGSLTLRTADGSMFRVGAEYYIDISGA